MPTLEQLISEPEPENKKTKISLLERIADFPKKHPLVTAAVVTGASLALLYLGKPEAILDTGLAALFTGLLSYMYFSSVYRQDYAKRSTRKKPPLFKAWDWLVDHPFISGPLLIGGAVSGIVLVDPSYQFHAEKLLNLQGAAFMTYVWGLSTLLFGTFSPFLKSDNLVMSKETLASWIDTNRGNYQKAIKRQERILSVEKTWGTMMEMAYLYGKIGQMDAAFEYFGKALKYRYETPLGFRKSTPLSKFIGRLSPKVFPAAWKEYEKNPEGVFENLWLAKAYVGRKERDKAVNVFENLKKKNPDNVDIACLYALFLTEYQKEKSGEEWKQVINTILARPDTIFTHIPGSRNEVFTLSGSSLIQDSFVIKRGDENIRHEFGLTQASAAAIDYDILPRPLYSFEKEGKEYALFKRMSGTTVAYLTGKDLREAMPHVLRTLLLFQQHTTKNKTAFDEKGIILSQRDYTQLLADRFVSRINPTSDPGELCAAFSRCDEYIKSNQHAVIHGDGNLGNFIYEEQGRMIIIDLERMCIDMPQSDIFDCLEDMRAEFSRDERLNYLQELLAMKKSKGSEADRYLEGYNILCIPKYLRFGAKFWKDSTAEPNADKRNVLMGYAANHFERAAAMMKDLSGSSAYQWLNIPNFSGAVSRVMKNSLAPAEIRKLFV